MPLPLWNRNSGNIQVANARQQQAETALRVSQREVERQVMDSLAGSRARFSTLARGRLETIEQMRNAAELGDRQYGMGAVPITTYVEWQEKYLEAVEAYCDLNKAGYAAAQQLEILTGTKLTEENG